MKPEKAIQSIKVLSWVGAIFFTSWFAWLHISILMRVQKQLDFDSLAQSFYIHDMLTPLFMILLGLQFIKPLRTKILLAHKTAGFCLVFIFLAMTASGFYIFYERLLLGYYKMGSLRTLHLVSIIFSFLIGLYYLMKRKYHFHGRAMEIFAGLVVANTIMGIYTVTNPEVVLSDFHRNRMVFISVLICTLPIFAKLYFARKLRQQ